MSHLSHLRAHCRLHMTLRPAFERAILCFKLALPQRWDSRDG